MPSSIQLSVVYAKCLIFNSYTELPYGECSNVAHYAECHYAGCRYAEGLGASMQWQKGEIEKKVLGKRMRDNSGKRELLSNK